MTEKIGYGLGDVATNFFFQSMILYQNRYYTDTVGLSPALVGWMFLIVRLADAFFDPIIGAMADRTNTRWGKFRPWILWTAIPFGVIFWLVYVTPNFGPQGKTIYAVVTYLLLMIIYSANNTPYSALMGVMTPNVNERTNIARYRFVSALIGQFFVQALGLPLVQKFGQGNDAKGWAATMAIFGAVMIICNFIVFFTTKERVLPNPEQKSSVKEDIKNVVGCKPWLAMFVLTLAYFTLLVVRGTSLNYLFTYYIEPSALGAFLNGWGLTLPADGIVTGPAKALEWLNLLVRPDFSNATAVGFSFFQVVGSIVQILFIPFSKPLSEKFGKKSVFVGGMALTLVVTAAHFFITPTSITYMFWLSVFWGAGWALTVPLLWVMIADVADYSEWQTTQRATGFMYAGILFALKAGLGLGGALASWIMGWHGYIANAEQTPGAILGIRLGISVYPSVFMGICLLCLAAYPIGKELNLRIQNELEERRKKFGGAAA